MIRILETGDEAALEAFLTPRIDSSMFLLGNMRIAGFVDDGEAHQGTYAAAFENGEIVAVVAHYWNRNLIFQAPDHLEALLPVVVKASGRAVKGLLGSNDQIDNAKVFLGLGEGDYQIDEPEKLYSLSLDELVEPKILLEGSVNSRLAVSADTKLLTRQRVAYSLEILGGVDSPELWQDCRDSVERAIKGNNMWVLEENGRFISTTAFNTATKEAVQVGGVWTPPEFRRRGYARAAVAVSLQDARADGVPKAILFTGNDNLAAQKAYEALGFRHIGDYCITLLKTAVFIS